MKKLLSLRALGILSLCGIVFLLAYTSCTQYDYASPSPGIIEVHLKTISNNIDFSPLNNFVLKVAQVNAIRSNGSQVLIFADIQAKDRATSVYNTLDVRARDSSLVIGQGYAPPGDYVGFNLQVSPGSQIVLNGYQEVDVVPLPSFDPLLQFRKPFSVSDSKGTRITLTVNLDSTLVKRSQTFSFQPYYYVSSVTTF